MHLPRSFGTFHLFAESRPPIYSELAIAQQGAVIEREQALDDALVVDNAARDELQQVMVAAVDQMAFDDFRTPFRIS